jgi:hypothetical protein
MITNQSSIDRSSGNLPAPSFSSLIEHFFNEEGKRKRQRLCELQIARSNRFKLSVRTIMYLQSLRNVHVRWPGQTSGAFGLALIFLVLFASKQKEQKVKSKSFVFGLTR